MKILTIVGARPQFVKAAPVSAALKKKHREILVHTGQHYDIEMSKLFFDELSLPRPDYNLGAGSGSHGIQTGKILAALEPILIKEKPKAVLVYGDTNSTLAGALCAAKLHIPVAHVEAGLRSYNRIMPEEINRVLTDQISTLNLCPCKEAVDNLKKEGVTQGVIITGDVMIDSLKRNIRIAETNSDIIHKLKLVPGEFVLTTIHRPANTDIRNNLGSIINAFGKMNSKVIFPVHPRTIKYLKLYGLMPRLKAMKNVIVIKPVGYLDFLVLEKNAGLIMTDSGGIQKEAYFFKVPCVTLRDESEWRDTIKSGWNVLSSVKTGSILKAANRPKPSGRYKHLYGRGNAADKIVRALKRI